MPLLRRRPPLKIPALPILFFILFSGLVLYFFAERQRRSAQDHRMRLLAGLSDRVETALEDLADRLTLASASRTDVARYLESVSGLEIRSVQDLDGGGVHDLQVPRLLFTTTGAVPHLIYEGPGCRQKTDGPGAGGQETDSTVPCRRTTSPEELAELQYLKPAPEDPADDLRSLRVHSRIDLETVLRPMILPEVFDALIIADQDGMVLFQDGEPELRVSDVAPLLAAAEPSLGEEELASATHTAVSRIADTDYHLFVQPITIKLGPASRSGPPRVERWIACGFVSSERLLSASVTTSPVLLFILVATFPAALISWPFLKLWFISPRQRFTRWDVAGLLLSTFLAASLLTLLAFDLAFLLETRRTVDQQLEDLASKIEGGFRGEVRDALRQAALVARDPRYRRAGDDPPPTMWEDLDTYPLFESIAWIDSDGRQVDKFAFEDADRIPNPVGDRKYFQCALGLARGEPLPDTEETALHWVTLELEGRLETFCIDSIRSKTTREDLTVLAFPFPEEPGESGEPAVEGTGLPVVAVVTRLSTLTLPFADPAFGFAILGPEGQVKFHSDPRRNLAEDFLKASDEDPVLAGMIRERREGPLTLSYWGRSHRLFVRPLEGLPWSLVTLRRTQDLRLRNFELVYDFLNLFLLHALLVVVLCAVLMVALPSEDLSYLWPDQDCTAVYRAIVLGAMPLIGGSLLVLSFRNVAAIAFMSFFLPLAAVGGTVIAVCGRRWLKERLDPAPAGKRVRKEATPLRPWEVTLYWTATLLILAALILGGIPEGGHPGWDLAPLVLVGVVLFLQEYPGPPGHPAGRARPLGFSLAVVAAVFALGLPLVGTAPAHLLLTVSLLTLFACWRRYRHNFEPPRRRKAYIFALSCLLFVVAVLPAVGFFELARSRQEQSLVTVSHAGLAESLEARAEELARRYEARGKPVEAMERFLLAPPDPCSGQGGHRDGEGPQTPGARAPGDGQRCGEEPPYVDRLRERLAAGLGVFYRTSLRPAGRGTSTRPPEGPGLGPRELTWRSRPRGPDADAEGPASTNDREAEEPWIASLMRQRPVPVNDLTVEPVGSDLSRFASRRGSWWVDGGRLHSRHHFDWGTGTSVELVSPLGPAPADGDGSLGKLGVGLVLLLLIAAPAGLAYVVADDVLLVKVVSSRGNQRAPEPGRTAPPAPDGGGATGSGRAADARAAEDFVSILARAGKPSRPPARVLLITSIPELAIRAVLDDDSPQDACLTCENVDLQAFGDFAGVPAMTAQVSSERRLASARLLVLTHFRPHLEDRAKGERQLNALQEVLNAGKRGVVIVSTRDPSLLLSEAKAGEEDGSDSLYLQRRWRALLASFEVRRGRDVGDRCRLCAEITRVHYQRREAHEIDPDPARRAGNTIDPDLCPGLLSGPREHRAAELVKVCGQGRYRLKAGPLRPHRQTGYRRRLFQRVWEECRHTRNLQRIGAKVIEEIHPDSVGLDQLVAKIGLLARSYYQAIWEGCDTDEKVVLAQLAEEGVVNPKSYERVIDLMQKGLIIRDPELQIMNRSFRRFIRREVGRSEIIEWEHAGGLSAWSVLKWLLPLPLLLLSGFLFLTQRDAFSNTVGVVIAGASLAPTLINLFTYFQQVTGRRPATPEPE